MENISSIKDNVDSLFKNLERFLKTETVVGEPIVVGDITLVPIISVVFGCGTGEGQADKKQGAGGGLGAAAKVTPNAIVVIKDDKVTLLPINGKSNLDNLLDMVPGILSKIKTKKPEKVKSEVNNK
ncbi:GerW family sporulation protein [Clostridium akagii]|uniref:GerW family sporulation protein n=1 Tax=Clostridium akagii TaxID=91623 RepID=UPI00047B87AB|nr:spore germination protein GerW family protein [Clostridium akagii]